MTRARTRQQPGTLPGLTRQGALAQYAAHLAQTRRASRQVREGLAARVTAHEGSTAGLQASFDEMERATGARPDSRTVGTPQPVQLRLSEYPADAPVLAKGDCSDEFTV